MLNNTTKQFEVAYDPDKKAINLLTQNSYTKIGNEMVLTNSGIGAKTVNLNTAKIYFLFNISQLWFCK